MKQTLKRFFTQNILLKVLSFAFALMLWIHVSLGQTESEVPAKVSVEIKNLPKRLVRTSDLPNELEIKVRGPRTVLRGVRDRELRYIIDLTGAIAGPMVAKVYSPKIEGLPKGAKVTEIVPSQIQITLAERKEKTVRVNAVLRGAPAGGLEVLATEVDPSAVEVSGAADEVDLLTEVDTEIIDVSEREKTFSVEVGLDLINRHVEPVTVQNVRVAVQIGQPRISQVFYGIPIVVVGTDYQYKLSKNELDVVLEGSQEQIVQLTPGDLQLVLDASGFAPGKSYEVKPALKVSAGMSYRNADMPAVQITILDKKLKTSKKGTK